MRNHVFEKIFELRDVLERRIVGGRRRVRISRMVRRREWNDMARKAGGLM